MMWMLRLYVIGTVLSLLSVFVGLVDSLGGLQILWGSGAPSSDLSQNKVVESDFPMETTKRGVKLRSKKTVGS